MHNSIKNITNADTKKVKHYSDDPGNVVNREEYINHKELRQQQCQPPEEK